MGVLKEAAEKYARHILETEDNVTFSELPYGTRNETLLREYWDSVNFDGDDLFKNIPLSEDFLREIVDEITPHHWEIITLNQRLSEKFIEEFKDKSLVVSYIWDRMSLRFRRRYKELNNKKKDEWY